MNCDCMPGLMCPICDTAATGQKHDTAKPRYSLLPWKAVDELVRVLEHGAAKYGPENWRKVTNGRQRYLNAALRHIAAVLAAGERNDAESGFHHLAHAAVSLLFALEHERGAGT